MLQYLAACALPKSTQNTPVLTIPFNIIDNRPFIEVQIADTILHFIVDCGGINAIDVHIAEKLNLTKTNPSQIAGAGESLQTIWNTIIPQIIIASDTLTSQSFIALALSDIKENIGLPYFDGIIGHDYFGDKIIQIDYPNQLINLFSNYKAPNPTPFSLFHNRIPLVKAVVENTEVDILIDTGDRSELTLLSHTAKQLKLSKKYKLSESKITGYGVGGPVWASTFNLKQLIINTHSFTNISTRIPTAKSGLFALTEINGSIGGGLLKKIYPHNRLHQPNNIHRNSFHPMKISTFITIALSLFLYRNLPSQNLTDSNWSTNASPLYLKVGDTLTIHNTSTKTETGIEFIKPTQLIWKYEAQICKSKFMRPPTFYKQLVKEKGTWEKNDKNLLIKLKGISGFWITLTLLNNNNSQQQWLLTSINKTPKNE